MTHHTPLRVFPQGDPTFGGLIKAEETDAVDLVAMTAIPRATVLGKPSVDLLVRLPDGRFVVAQTTLALFLTAAIAFKAAHGDPTL